MPNARFMLVTGLAVLVALAGFAFIHNLIDFPVYYAAGQSLLSGRTDLYAPDFALGRVMDYRYPPFFLLAFRYVQKGDFTITYKVAAYLWYLFSIAEIALCVLFIRRVAAIPSEKRWLWLVVFFAVAPYFVIVLHYGNAHLLAIFLLFAACYLAFDEKPVFAGLALALAISIKLTPALLLPYFALRKQWRLLAAVAVFLVAINLAPAIYFGFAKNHELLKNWFEQLSNAELSALHYQGGSTWRARITTELGKSAAAFLKEHDDAALAALFTDLGGHCMETLVEAFDAAQDHVPTLFIAWTIKGHGLPFAGHKDNHSGLMNPTQVAAWREAMGVREGHEWEALEGVGENALPAVETLLERNRIARTKRSRAFAQVPRHRHSNAAKTHQAQRPLYDGVAAAGGTHPLSARPYDDPGSRGPGGSGV